MAEQFAIDDWEFGNDFYQEKETKTLSLEDFVNDEAPDAAKINAGEATNPGFAKTVQDVAAVRKLYNSGQTITDVSSLLGLEPEYVRIIMITLNSISEDDTDEAVAHLVMMSL
jgi:hypothetical protein